MPANRLEALYARDGLQLARSTICGWHEQLADLVEARWRLLAASGVSLEQAALEIGVAVVELRAWSRSAEGEARWRRSAGNSRRSSGRTCARDYRVHGTVWRRRWRAAGPPSPAAGRSRSRRCTSWWSAPGSHADPLRLRHLTRCGNYGMKLLKHKTRQTGSPSSDP
ncbi:hypothetical protein [Nannocystis pusilla]|uniref:hypothetical protein n=1 Tax=Nannocystis pusilla TaxID=889268 RepID=UPI003B82E84F